MNAETQTCASWHSPLWVDDHFSFLQLTPPAEGAAPDQHQHPAEPSVKQPQWSKVRQHCLCCWFQMLNAVLLTMCWQPEPLL